MNLPEMLAPLTTSLQKICAEAFPAEMKSRIFAQSFLCGTKITDKNSEELFRSTGLLHLMVVSGSHLQILALFFLLPWPQRWKNKPSLLIGLLALLFGYCLLTGFQPPLVRAFIARLVIHFNETFKLFWDQGKVQLSAGLLTLMIIPEWILSFSFYLSWAASLGFLLAPLWQKEKSHWIARNALTCLLIQCFVSVSFSYFSILGTFINALFAPIIAVCLFPLSAVALIHPRLSHLADLGWNFLLQFLQLCTKLNPQTGTPSFPDLSTVRWIQLWLFLSLVHCFFELLVKYRYRGQHV